ncbi:Hypothetical Protein NG00_00402 [Corynebacterium camporealensis]|uniref:Uncharacterized protein n=1 Tax=Corynebacterium camporealensis TaxID=161896 RepID=A0A0F6QX37_9CORY|nr:PH domain-containing protein [Corynebacterium camporealensis]AKE38428.1 hypothetical protein UL81_02235 [Corynebacterium camporealensis]AVH87730.1 Hypothetical Protein NG00_00402 [Corynebacterium camporealensis]MDY5840376.1 PH domain-containing protein [Corynebacterium camporealensis]
MKTAADMNPVSPKLVPARYISNLIFMVILIALSLGAVFLWGNWWYIATGVFVAYSLWLVWLIPAQVRNTGWLETSDELLITRGKLWHSFTVIPYGRIQFVDVQAGPIERSFGLKTVELHTASAGTDASVPGLPAEEADALRERLAEQARERMSGL